MRIVEELENGHKLIGKSTSENHVIVRSYSPDGDECIIGIFPPEEQVDFETNLDEVFGLDNLTQALENILSKFARRWE